MSGVREAGVGKISQLVGFEIENSDRLMCLRLLCAVPIVEQSRVLSVRA